MKLNNKKKIVIGISGLVFNGWIFIYEEKKKFFF